MSSCAEPLSSVRIDCPVRRGVISSDFFHFPAVSTSTPPRIGSRCPTRIADAYEKEGKRGGTMTFYELVTEFVDESGTLVAEEKTTMIITGKATTD